MALQLSQEKKPDPRSSVSGGLPCWAVLLPRADQGAMGIDRLPVRLIVARRNFSISKAVTEFTA
jgi:hypothetical protein